ncbi:MAG: SDR family NAD(P)-dependent oxidoreductase [Solirubrobacteraceae bacterium]
MPTAGPEHEPAWGLDARVAVVTGAGSGIGAATTRLLAEAGATVVGADVDLAAAQATASYGERIQAAGVDVRDERSVSEMIAAAHALHGRLDILVNVAGVGSTTSAPDTPLEVWDNVFAVNARGTFLCCKQALAHMVEQGDGVIINMASVAGLVGLRNRAAYCASKGAVIAFTRALAIDHVKQGVRVNCICPGTIETPWVHRLVKDVGESLDELKARQPMGRLGTPDEVAQAVRYLVSDAGRFITGSSLVIDGGLTAA